MGIHESALPSHQAQADGLGRGNEDSVTHHIHIWGHWYLTYSWHWPHIDIRSPIMMSIYHLYGTYVIAGITMAYAIAAALRMRPSRRRISINQEAGKPNAK
jgi:hypothetical protein